MGPRDVAPHAASRTQKCGVPAFALANLAEVAQRRGDTTRCAALYGEAAEIREALLGRDAPVLAVPRDGLARCRRTAPD